MNIKNLEIAFSIILGWIAYFMGGKDGILVMLIILMIIEYLTSQFVRISNKGKTFDNWYSYLIKKFMILFLVGIANLLDKNLMANSPALRSIVALFYISNEGLNVLDNADALGLPIPQKLVIFLRQIKKEETDGKS